MKFGVYNAILHDRALPEAIKVIAGLGLTGIELNSGGFLPRCTFPTFDDILTSDTARDDFLGQFEGTGVGNRRPELQRQPAASRPGHRAEPRRGHPPQHPAGEPAGPAPGGHDVRPAGRRAGGQRPNWIVNAWNSGALDVLDYQWGVPRSSGARSTARRPTST